MALKVPSPARDAGRARALRRDRGGGPGGRTADRARPRTAARRRPGLLEAPRAAAGHVADLDGGLAGDRALRQGPDHRRARAARRRRRARRPAPALAGPRSRGSKRLRRLALPGGPGAPAAVLGRGDRLRRHVRARRAVRRLRAGRLEHREADGHGVHHGDQRVRLVPAARPVDERRDAQLLLPRPRRSSRGRSSCSGCGRTRATCSRGALLLALTATAVYAFSGTLWAAARESLGERAPRGGPVLAGLVGAALVAILGNLAGVRSWIRRRGPAEATTPGSTRRG